jgi:RNA polymerase sigma-70 factor (ECF subfamily)
MHSEDDLIKHSQQGDETAFRLIVEKYKSALFGTAYLILQDYQKTEETVQEAVLKIWEHLPSLRDNNKFKSWLLRIVVNEARQLLRRKMVTTVSLEKTSELIGDYDMDEILINSENHRLLKQAVSELPSGQREVVILRYYNELTIPEIAVAISTREGTVKSRLSRALDHLEEIMHGNRVSKKGDSYHG